MRKKLILYTQPGCKSCLEFKRILNETTLPYKEMNVFDYQPMWESIRKGEEGVMYTPTVGVEDPREQTITYLAAGRDFDGEEEGIEKLKNLL